MNRNQTMIKIEELFKDYKLGQIGASTLTAELQSFIAKRKGKEDPNKVLGGLNYQSVYGALKNINLEIFQGDTIGIIGGNGAGKSTLLKLLARVTAPTKGTISYNGRIASMLEVGTGFNGEMTGRENIYLNGAILGMTKTEVDNKIEQIIEFSECRTFIDTPVKRYSSGMYVKLAFAVASHLDSEIMIMDEVLAVGDMKFQRKCLEKMRDLAKQEGRTVLYVSHNMSTIRQLCNRCIVLSKGELIYDGNVDGAIDLYMNDNDMKNSFYDLSKSKRTIQSRKVLLDSFEILEKQSNNFFLRDKMYAKIKWHAIEDVVDFYLRLLIYYADGTVVGIASHKIEHGKQGKEYDTDIEFDISDFTPGKYHMYVSFCDSKVLFASTPYDAPVEFVYFEIENDVEWEPYWNHYEAGHRILDNIRLIESKEQGV